MGIGQQITPVVSEDCPLNSPNTKPEMLYSSSLRFLLNLRQFSSLCALVAKI